MDPRLGELWSRRKAGEHLAAIRLAQRILEHPEGLTDEDAFEVARNGAIAAMFLDRFHEAYRFTEQACFWAEAAGNDVQRATAAYYEGTILLYIGRTAEAVERLQTYVQNSHLMERYLGAALFNLGVAATLRQKYPAAGQHLAQARDWFRKVGNVHREIQALLELAWTELLQRRMEPACYHLDQARALLEQHPDAHLQAVRFVHTAYYHLQANDLVPAMQLCEEVLNPGRLGVTAHERSEAAWIYGECALAEGRLHTARYMAALAMDEAIKDKWPAVMNRANDLRRRLIQMGEQAAE